MKIRFVKEARIDDKVAFEKDTVHDLAEPSALRWIVRGIAVKEEDSKIAEVAHKVTDKVKEVASTVVEKLDAVVNAEPEYEHSDGAAKQEEIVANDASVEENKSNKKAQAKNVKGL